MRVTRWLGSVLGAAAVAAIVVSCGGTGGGGGSKGHPDQQFILNSNNAGRLTFNVDPREVDANKSDRIGLVAVLTDNQGNGIAGVAITFTSDIDDISFIPGGTNASGVNSGLAVTDANGRADIIAVAGSQPTSTGAIIGTGAIFATTPTGFSLRAQVQVTLLDIGFIDADVLGVIPSQIDLGNPAFGTVLVFVVVGGTPPYSLSNPTSGIGFAAFGQRCLPGCTENGGCIGSPCQTDSDCNLNGSPTPAGVCQGPIKRCLASCAGNNCAGAQCSTDSDCNNGSPTPANVCKDSGQNLAYTVTVGCGNGSAESSATDGATHKFQVFDAAAAAVDITVVVSLSEQCDGSDLAGETCVSQGFQGGTLRCTAGCGLDTSGCTNAAPVPTFTPGGGVPTPTPTGGGAGTPTPVGTPGVGIPSNLLLALLTNGSGDNGDGTMTTVVAATVSDINGNPVPDGTQVLFSIASPTTGAVISSPSGTNQDPLCDVSNFEIDTGVTVLNQPGVAHACITYPTLQAGTGRTITAVSGAASDSQVVSLP